jgi:PilZ domain
MASVANDHEVTSRSRPSAPGDAVPRPQERRVSPRIGCYVGATVRVLDADPRHGDAILSYAVELSETGALIRTLRTLPPGLRVEIALTSRQKSASAVIAHGEIVRTSTPRARGDTHDLGIRFDAPLALAKLLSA